MADCIAAIHKDADSDYGVSFPDFPGCITAGKTIDEAKDLVKQALDLHVEGMNEDGDELPVPSKLEKILADDDYAEMIAFMLVPAPVEKSKTVRVNITVMKTVLSQIDSAAKKRGMSRSMFLVRSAREAIERNDKSQNAWFLSLQ